MPGFNTNRFIDLNESLVKHLKCSICLNIYKNAVTTHCGHTFCKSCVKKLINANHKVCPECRQLLGSRKRISSEVTNEGLLTFVKDVVLENNLKINAIINEFKIKCNYSPKGCQQVIELGLLLTHLSECEYNLCKDCGFKVGKPSEHNCLQLMKNDRNKYKNGFIKSYNETNSLREKINELELNCEELKKECQQFKQLEQLLDSKELHLGFVECYEILTVIGNAIQSSDDVIINLYLDKQIIYSKGVIVVNMRYNSKFDKLIKFVNTLCGIEVKALKLKSSDDKIIITADNSDTPAKLDFKTRTTGAHKAVLDCLEKILYLYI